MSKLLAKCIEIQKKTYLKLTCSFSYVVLNTKIIVIKKIMPTKTCRNQKYLIEHFLTLTNFKKAKFKNI